MPIYSFRCSNCQKEFEHFFREPISVASKEYTDCPNCNSRVSPENRILRGTVGLQFNGSGFYATDYKNTEPSTSNS